MTPPSAANATAADPRARTALRTVGRPMIDVADMIVELTADAAAFLLLRIDEPARQIRDLPFGAPAPGNLKCQVLVRPRTCAEGSGPDMRNAATIEELMRIHDECVNTPKLARQYETESWSARGDYLIYYLLARIYSPDNVLECGTCAGMSAMVWALGLKHARKKGHVHTVDVRHCAGIDEASDLRAMIIRHHGAFATLASKLMASLSGRRLIYIDGDHTKAVVHAEVMAVRSHLRRNDVIVLHDVRLFRRLDRVAKDLLTSAHETYLLPTRLGIRVIRW